jgi:predicted DNA-binding transcriptional regulator AlpA
MAKDRDRKKAEELPAAPDRTNDKLLTTKEVAGFLNKAEQSLVNDRFDGKGLPYVKVGKRSIRYWKSDVMAHCQNRVEPKSIEG